MPLDGSHARKTQYGGEGADDRVPHCPESVRPRRTLGHRIEYGCLEGATTGLHTVPMSPMPSLHSGQECM
jgi:hypothetical protein